MTFQKHSYKTITVNGKHFTEHRFIMEQFLKRNLVGSIVRKIVSDYVTYHRVKKENPIKELPTDQE